LVGNPELDAFLLDRLHDGGKFYVVLSGTTDGKTDLVVDVNLHARWDTRRALLAVALPVPWSVLRDGPAVWVLVPFGSDVNRQDGAIGAKCELRDPMTA